MTAALSITYPPPARSGDRVDYCFAAGPRLGASSLVPKCTLSTKRSDPVAFQVCDQAFVTVTPTRAPMRARWRTKTGRYDDGNRDVSGLQKASTGRISNDARRAMSWTPAHRGSVTAVMERIPLDRNHVRQTLLHP